jgi:hypothetical protein
MEGEAGASTLAQLQAKLLLQLSIVQARAQPYREPSRPPPPAPATEAP